MSLYTNPSFRRDCRNPSYMDVLRLPSMALDTRFPAGMTTLVYHDMGYKSVPWQRSHTKTTTHQESLCKYNCNRNLMKYYNH